MKAFWVVLALTCSAFGEAPRLLWEIKFPLLPGYSFVSANVGDGGLKADGEGGCAVKTEYSNELPGGGTTRIFWVRTVGRGQRADLIDTSSFTTRIYRITPNALYLALVEGETFQSTRIRKYEARTSTVQFSDIALQETPQDANSDARIEQQEIADRTGFFVIRRRPDGSLWLRRFSN